MPPRIAIVTDDAGWHGAQLRAWFSARGATVDYVSLTHCDVDLAGGPEGLVTGEGAGALPDAVFVRGIPGGSLEAITFRLDVLHHLAHVGVPVFNTARAIERTVDKAMTSLLLARHGIPTPQTFVSESFERTAAYIDEALARGMTLVKKPLFGSQGKGLRRIREAGDLGYLMPGEIAYLQPFVGPADGPYCDYRVLVVDGEAVAAMRRESSHWITNRAQGAQCRSHPLDATLTDLALRATAVVGADYAGVDLMQDRDGEWLVTEVNGIPAWVGLQQASGVDISAVLAAALWRRLRGAAA